MFKFGDKVQITEGPFAFHTGIVLRQYYVGHVCAVDVRIDRISGYDDSRRLDFHIFQAHAVRYYVVQQPVTPPPLLTVDEVEKVLELPTGLVELMSAYTGVQAGPRYRSLPVGSKRKIGYEYRMLDSDTWCPGKIRSVGRVITAFNASVAEYRIPVREKVKKEKGPSI
jgi:hypothetical protein